MNENQSAHGDREYGHIVSRMGIVRKVDCRTLGSKRSAGKDRFLDAHCSRCHGKQPISV